MLHLHQALRGHRTTLFIISIVQITQISFTLATAAHEAAFLDIELLIEAGLVDTARGYNPDHNQNIVTNQNSSLPESPFPPAFLRLRPAAAGCEFVKPALNAM